MRRSPIITLLNLFLLVTNPGLVELIPTGIKNGQTPLSIGPWISPSDYCYPHRTVRTRSQSSPRCDVHAMCVLARSPSPVPSRLPPTSAFLLPSFQFRLGSQASRKSSAGLEQEQPVTRTPSHSHAHVPSQSVCPELSVVSEGSCELWNNYASADPDYNWQADAGHGDSHSHSRVIRWVKRLFFTRAFS